MLFRTELVLMDLLSNECTESEKSNSGVTINIGGDSLHLPIEK